MYWKPTYDTPLVNLTDTTLTIQGKSFMDDAYSFYQPIIKKLPSLKGETFKLELNLSKLNIETKNQIVKIVALIKQNNHIKNFRIQWLYSSSENAYINIAKELENKTNIRFEIQFPEVYACLQ